MAQTIKLKRSSVSGNTPSTSDLELGEVAINTYDGKMFIKKNDGSDSIVEIGGSSGTVTEAFKTIAVSGQSPVVADSATDTLTLVAGSNMTITTNASGDTVTFASSGSGGSQNLFSTFAVSGQSSVVADSTTDTLTLVAGTGITLTTDASADSITITNSATGANAFGNVLVSGQSTVAADGTNDNLTLVAGTGITLTTDASADSVTITNSAAAGNSFGTIAVSGQGSVVADQANDTLTLVAGSNVTLTTSAAGDSVTIASSGGGGGGSVDAGASITEFKFDVSSSTSSFSGSDANSNTLAYTAGAIQVYLNGILLDPATDYTATNGTAVVLTDAASSGDDLQIIAFNRKILNANTTVNTFTGDGSTTAFTLSTDPVNENNTNVFIDGVYQSKSNYSVSGTTLTFSTAPPDTSAIEVSLGFQQASISSTLDFDDNAILRFGDSQDLHILHDGFSSVIKDRGTGSLIIGASTLEIKNAALNETMIKAIQAGAVELYHNNSKKLETVTGGVTVTGTVTATTFSGDLSGTINAATTGTTQSASDNSTKIATTAYVDTAVTNLVDSAPGTLNTLNELAAALGDDANFSTTITNSLATKVGLTATTGAANIPAGTTAQRPGSPAAGQFRYNSTLNQFEGYTSSWGAIGGGGTNTFTTNVFTGDGSTTAFTLSQAVSSVNDCIVHVGGIYQVPTDAYTVSGTTLTFTSAPANTRKIVVYSVKAGVSGNNLNVQTFSGDGSARSFTLSVNPINENNTIVHIDGVYQQKSSYAVSGTTLTFGTQPSHAPANGTTIEVATFTQTEINVPVNDTIDTVHIKDDAVTSAKLGGNLTTPGNLTVTGVIGGSAGSASAPSLSFSGDLNTGLYSVAADNIGFAIGGLARAFMSATQFNMTGNIIASGNLGGTLTTAAQPNITSVGTLTNFTSTGIDDNASSTSVKIDSSGNLGVGTGNTSIASKIMLTEPSYARLTLNQSTTGRNWQIGNDGNNFYIYDATAAVRALDIKSDGKVGIGVSNPESGLHLYDGTNVGSPQNANRRGTLIIEAGSEGSADIQLLNASYSHIFFGDAADPNTGMIWYQHAAGGSGADSMHFGTAGKTDDITIKSDGFVGIGESNPARRLSVRRDTGITAGFNDISQFLDTTLGSGGSVSLNLGRANSTKNLGKMAFKYAGAGSNSNALNFGFYDADNLMTLTAGGNVGIGNPTPTEKLHVEGSVLIDAFNAGSETGLFFREGFSSSNKYNQSILAYDHNGSAPDGLSINAYDGISFCTGSNTRAEKMRIKQDGNVGIGVQNPLSPLSVQADTGAGARRFIGRGSDSIASVGFYNSGQSADTYLQSNGAWQRARADSGFHFRKGGTPTVTDTDGFTIEGMNVGIGTANPTEALEVAGNVKLTGTSRILLPNFWIGRVPNTLNNNNGAVLLVNLTTQNANNVGFQFSGSIIGNSYTGQAFVNANIVKHYSNDNVAFDVADDQNLNSTVTRMQLRLCTVTYSGNSYLAIVKVGGGTGTIQLNAYIQGWDPSVITEVASGTYTITTNHGNLNF